MIYARQSTAIIVTVGPCLDATGVADTGVVVGALLISKNGGAPAALNASATLTHRNTGYYSLSLTATDVNTLGTVEIVINDTTTACPIKEIMVLPANSYDALVSGTGVGMRSDIQGIGADAQSATDLKDFADAGYDPATNKVEGVKLADTLTTYTNNTPQTGDSFARLGAPVGASIAADIAVIESQTDDIGLAGAGLTALATQASVDAVDNLIDTEVAAIKTVVDAIQAKTDALPTDPADQSLIIAATDAVMARLGAPAGASVSADVAAVKIDTAAILLDTGTDGVVVAAASKTGYALSSAGVTAIWAEVVEGAVSAVQMMRGFAAVLFGKASGLGTATAVFRDVGDTKDRVTATVDADGNRTAVTKDLT